MLIYSFVIKNISDTIEMHRKKGYSRFENIFSFNMEILK